MGFLISYETQDRLDKYNESHKLPDFLNDKTFKVADIPLTYRQVNVLSAAKLLGADSQSNGKWRKFSFKELAYISLLVELKKFGFDHKQIRNLHESFFKKQGKTIESKLFNKSVADTAIVGVFAGIEVSVLAFSDGEVFFCDPTTFLTALASEPSYVRITLNDIINDILKKIGQKPIYPDLTVDKLCSKLVESEETIKEKQVLDILRNSDFSAIKIKKKDGRLNIVYAERDNQGKSTPSSVDLIKTLKESDFQDISITKRDGKIVNYRVEQAFKL